MIINTSSIGAYPTFVRARERLEHKIGKPARGGGLRNAAYLAE